MIKKDENSFQLLFTALVLVLIAVGGTLAWFASNRTASVDRFQPTLSSPDDFDDFDGEPMDYYDFDKGVFEDNGEAALTYVPGKNMIFRVETEANLNATVQLVLIGADKPVLGNVVKIGFCNAIDNDWKRNNRISESLCPKPTATINSLAEVGTRGWTITSDVSPAYDSDGRHNYLYFFLYMDPAAGEEPANLQPGATYENYQNLELRFKIAVTYS